MEIGGVTYTEKETAGKVILEACTKMTGSDAIPFGRRRSFFMFLLYDNIYNQYRVSYKYS